MQALFEDIAQIRTFFDKTGNVLSQRGDQELLRSEVNRYFQTKKQQYAGKAYLDQIEKNAIYLREGTRDMSLEIATYLHKGKPKLKPQDIRKYLDGLKPTRAQSVVPHHLNYLHGTCRGCKVHREHDEYLSLRDLYLNGELAQYLDEIEFCYQHYQATYIYARWMLAGFLENPQYAGAAKRIQLSELATVSEERVMLWARLLMGYIQLGAAE